MKTTYKKITIRAATLKDAQKVRDLENAVWGVDVVNEYDIPVFVRFGYCFVAEVDGKIVGAMIGLLTRQSEIYVLDLVIDKVYRRLGIAEKLKRRLMKAGNGKNIVSFVHASNKASLALNAKIGIMTKKKMKNPFGLNDGEEYFIRIKPR